MDEPEPTSRKREHHWMRSLRPLVWWCIFVLFLFAYHTHERLSEQTRLKFTVDLEGKAVGDEASAALDGRRVTSGERVSIGRHQFAISHPKGELISSNLFIWYGERDLGLIRLQRTWGVLALRVDPPAARLSVLGAEFSVILTNSAGVTSSVPTDVYRIDAHWANHGETKQVMVTNGWMASLNLAPALGAATLESDPSGATVIGRDERELGMTPLTLPELPSGVWKGELRLDGYIPVPLALTITASHTNSFRTNLVNWQYAQAMESARTSFAAGDIERTFEALTAALKAKPNDSDATALGQKATVVRHLRRGEAMMVANNYPDVRAEAQAVLKIAPDNAQALALIEKVSIREKESAEKAQEQAEARRQEKLALPKKTYDFALRVYREAALFDDHELQTTLPLTQAEASIGRELETAPAFKLIKTQVPWPESFCISASQEVPGGLRRCVITGTQIAENETKILFKVMEYKTKRSVSFEGQLTFNTTYIPLDPSHIGELAEREKTQVRQGAGMVEERIRRAVGEKKP